MDIAQRALVTKKNNQVSNQTLTHASDIGNSRMQRGLQIWQQHKD
jgi:hypothetical protein